MKVNKHQALSKFSLPADYVKERPVVLWFLWIIFGDLLVSSWLPGSFWRRLLLRLYGARVGIGVLIKPRVKIKFPWRLIIGNYSWIGEVVWIDKLEWVSIGSDVCISQGCYLCTGNHDYRNILFPYQLGKIDIDDEAWICAMVRVSPSVRIGNGAVIEFGSVVCDSIPAGVVASGFPAIPKGSRL